jgi:hypothetical protein
MEVNIFGECEGLGGKGWGDEGCGRMEFMGFMD